MDCIDIIHIWKILTHVNVSFKRPKNWILNKIFVDIYYHTIHKIYQNKSILCCDRVCIKIGLPCIQEKKTCSEYVSMCRIFNPTKEKKYSHILCVQSLKWSNIYFFLLNKISLSKIFSNSNYLFNSIFTHFYIIYGGCWKMCKIYRQV